MLAAQLCWISATPVTVACQAPLSMGFSRQEYWSRLPYPSPREVPAPGIQPRSPASQADSLPSEPQGKPQHCMRDLQTLVCFPLCKDLYFPPCACVIFLCVLIFQEVCRTCQVCVLSHQYRLDLSKPSQSVDGGLLYSQMNYFLLCNYCLSFICGIPTIFIMCFLDLSYSLFNILQDFYHCIFCPWSFRAWFWSQMW